MKAKNLYFIQNSVMVILPEYTQFGVLHTKVLEVKESVLLDSRPYNMIDEHLRYFGSAISGAIEGSGAILNSKINPIALNGPELIILIPTKSPYRNDCIWFNLNHIKEFKPHSKKETLVLLSNGDTIIIDISAKQFEIRVNKGYVLQMMLQERKSKKLFYVLDPGKRYHYQRNNGKLNFEMRIDRKKDEK